MTEGNYKKAIYDALTEEYESMLPEVKVAHTFSSGFEKRMNRLVKRRNKSYYKMINTAAKRAACILGIIFVVSFTTIMSVSALREAFWEFFINTFERFSVVRSAEKDNSPTTIKDFYEISDGLDNYSIIYSEQDEISVNIIYEDNLNHSIDFSQYVKSEFDIAVNTENADVSPVEISGKKAIYYIDDQGYSNLIWDNDDYIIVISSNIGKDILIRMAESVQKVE